MLVGRSDNSCKNHWNSALRRQGAYLRKTGNEDGTEFDRKRRASEELKTYAKEYTQSTNLERGVRQKRKAEPAAAATGRVPEWTRVAGGCLSEPEWSGGGVRRLGPIQAPPMEGSGGGVAAELARRGLVRRDNSFSSRHRGVCWDTQKKKWQAQFYHGGKREHLDYFGAQDEAKACYDARCRELGLDPDAGWSSIFRGVTWYKSSTKWMA